MSETLFHPLVAMGAWMFLRWSSGCGRCRRPAPTRPPSARRSRRRSWRRRRSSRGWLRLMPGWRRRWRRRCRSPRRRLLIAHVLAERRGQGEGASRHVGQGARVRRRLGRRLAHAGARRCDHVEGQAVDRLTACRVLRAGCRVGRCRVRGDGGGVPAPVGDGSPGDRTDDGIDRLERQRRKTALRVWTDGVGMWRFDGRFDPLSGAQLDARLEAAVQALVRRSRAGDVSDRSGA